MTLETSSV
jgi:diketogulonate reductase-like aldo/keto reductase